MLQELDDYDWQQAFGYAGEPDTFASQDYELRNSAKIFGHRPFVAGTEQEGEPFAREDVMRIYAKSEGEHDGPNWLIVGQLKNHQWFYLSAGCDFTGWD